MDGNKKANNLPCEVVQDLLPLYADGVVSEKTAEAVCAHLEGCGDCQNEYELIKTHLPVEAERSTAGKFAETMKKLRIRRLIVIAIAVIMTCAVLAGGFWGLTQVPVKSAGAGNISVARSHLYKDEEGTRLFVWYTVPMWNSPSFQNMYIVETDEPGVWELKSEFKVAIISKRILEDDVWDAVWDLSVDADHDAVKSVIFEGETIWDAKDAAEVPDYVAAYREFNSPGDKLTGMTIDAEKNFIGFDWYEDQYYVYWDMDGNLLYEGDGTDADKVIDFDDPFELPAAPPEDDKNAPETEPENIPEGE